MYSEIRWAMVLLAIALAALPAWIAGRVVSGNLTVLSKWKRTQGVVVAMAADDYVEIELGLDPDTVRVKAPTSHHLGLSFLKKVPIYVDPGDPQRVRAGGLLQLWLWPTGLALAAGVLLIVAVTAANLGRGRPEDPGDAMGRWMFSPPPAPMATDIRVYRPASQWKIPLCWSLLGAALLACALLIRSANPISRMASGGAGLLFLLLMWGLAIEDKTTEISVDHTGMRKTTAFGWCQIRWEQVGSVETQRTIFGRSERILRVRDTSFPGREVTTVVFADHSGHKLVSMSPAMEPAKTMRRLLDTCADRTGLRMEFRTIYDRNF
jgi:hypothetical protein